MPPEDDQQISDLVDYVRAYSEAQYRYMLEQLAESHAAIRRKWSAYDDPLDAKIVLDDILDADLIG